MEKIIKIDFEANYTEQQQEFLNMIQNAYNKAEELEKSCHGFVIEGQDGAGESYCYCGEGHGYNGAPLRPSCIWAVVFNTEEEAKAKLSELTGYHNGAGHKITLNVCVAWYYFSCLKQDILGSLYTAKRVFNDANNNRLK